MLLTCHAQKRLQQRGISVASVEAILLYGKEYYLGKSTSYMNTKESEKMMFSDGIPSSFVDGCRGVYVVCDGQIVITVCHKH